MDRRIWATGLFLLLATGACISEAQGVNQGALAASRSYPGFDRNDFAGDAALAGLRKNFRYTSYWLNAPPGETANSWQGKRAILQKYGFGFMVLFNGRTDAEIKTAASRGQDAPALGAADGKAAAAAAAREGFPPDIVIFLDQEEGGRLLPEQAAYLFAFFDALRAAGVRPGVYCSGIDVPEGKGTISTARDIVERETALELRSCQNMPRGSDVCIGHEEARRQRLVLWIANDQCPPAPGCTVAAPRLTGAFSLPVSDFVAVWQYAQSPFRPEFSASCPAKPASDGNCYVPDSKITLDLDSANSPDPSESPAVP